MEDLEEQARALTNIHSKHYHPTALDDLLEELTSPQTGIGGGIVTDRFCSNRLWLWKQWTPTVLSHSLQTAYWNGLWALWMCWCLHRAVHGNWRVWSMPTLDDANTTALKILDVMQVIWNNLKPLTTLLLVFFVAQAYSFWSSCYGSMRSIQSSMQDLWLVCTSRAGRQGRHGTYTPTAQAFLQDLQHQLQAFCIFYWASQARPFRILLTERGTSRMVAKNILTQKEKELLDMQLAVPKTQKHWILLEAISVKLKEAQQQLQRPQEDTRHHRRPWSRIATRKPVLQGGEGLENVLLDKLTALRSACGQLNHKLSARMPLAYAHVVRMLVDVYLFLATIASYKQLGIFAAFQTALLSVFYVGLLDLAFCLLDPLDDEADLRENESMVYLDVSVLLRESITASQRWIAAGSRIVRS
jgi:hypothetical protein